MECPVCLESFDTTNHIPASLVCGHTFCMSHTELQVCPICRHSVPTNLKKNIALVDLLTNLKSKHHRTPKIDLDLEKVQQLAKRLNWNEISHHKKEFMVSFRNLPISARINVFYTTGTVATCLEHPHFGKTQLFRRRVSLEELEEIFRNPRVHTGKGYYNKQNTDTSLTSNDSNDDYDEEALLRQQEVELEAQLLIIKSQLKFLVESKDEIRQIRIHKIDEEDKKERERLRFIEEQGRARLVEEQRLARIAEGQRLARIAEEHRLARIAEAQVLARIAEAERLAEVKRLAKVEKKRLDDRGRLFDYSLHYSDLFPSNMNDCRCVAIGGACWQHLGIAVGTGYVVVNDSGTCSYHGIPSDISDFIKKQHNSNIRYIAIGEAGQYCIAKTNGKHFCSVNTEFSISKSVAFVSFGNESGIYYIQFNDGTYTWSGICGSFAEKIKSANTIEAVWLGGYGEYFISYNNGRVSYKNIPKALQSEVNKYSGRGYSIKQCLFDTRTESYFIRYT